MPLHRLAMSAPDWHLMKLPTKAKPVLFALLMASVTVSVVSFVLIWLNAGFVAGFVWIWLKSFAVAYVIVVPFILVVGPLVQRFVDIITA